MERYQNVSPDVVPTILENWKKEQSFRHAFVDREQRQQYVLSLIGAATMAIATLGTIIAVVFVSVRGDIAAKIGVWGLVAVIGTIYGVSEYQKRREMPGDELDNTSGQDGEKK